MAEFNFQAKVCVSPQHSEEVICGVFQSGEETAELKKSKLIVGKRFAGVKGIPSIVGVVVLVSVIMIVGLAWVSGGYLLSATRRKLRKKETPSNWYSLPGRLDFDCEPPPATANPAPVLLGLLK